MKSLYNYIIYQDNKYIRKNILNEKSKDNEFNLIYGADGEFVLAPVKMINKYIISFTTNFFSTYDKI